MGFVVDKVLKPVAGFVARTGTSVIGVGKKAAGKVLGFFGVRKYFTTDTGEKHSLYFEQRGEQTVLRIESIPQDIEEFLLFYVDKYKNNPVKMECISKIMSHLETYKKDYAKLKKLEEDSADAKSINRSLLERNEFLMIELRTLLSRNRTVGRKIESYMLEGLTGTYSSMPKPHDDILTADHQPQAAILKWCSNNLKIGGRKLFGENSEMARRAKGTHADQGYAINLHENRHAEGRTFGNKGKNTKQEFTGQIESFILSNPQTTGHKTSDYDQAVRDFVVETLKEDLEADVARMREVLKMNVWVDIDDHNLKTDIINRIEAGLKQIENQPMDNLKENK
jgi:hypothetical protein